MKQLLNTLYVTTSEAYLSKDGTNVVVTLEGKELFRIPISNVESINTFGYQGASPGLMRLCADNGVALTFFGPNGRFISRSQGPLRGNILLRVHQYEILGQEKEKLRLASRFIYGKLFNSRVILRRFIRDYPEKKCINEIEQISEKLHRLTVKSTIQTDIASLRALEGEGAACYFSVFRNLVLNSDPHFQFEHRHKRPPTDPVNAMLSFGYSLLANDCASALEGVGLDPAAGFMHALRPGRNSLALDLMEEMRSYIVDRLVLSLINMRQMTPKDFKIQIDPYDARKTSVVFTDNGLKKFLSAWQSKKKTEIMHPFLNEKIKIGLLPHVQAMLLARNLRGDLDDYPVFLAK